MPVTHEIDVPAAHVRIIGSGKVSMADMIAGVERVPQDPQFRSHFTVMFDLRATSYTAELSDGDALAAVLRRKKDDFQNKFAVVVPESLFFLAKLYCLLSTMGGFYKIQCFTDLAEARRWCGLAP